ncbi:YIP1 family protein [Candidatus Marinimicrobia bacterium]|nr:YIP1 family protein [Candidatus Neomarinimicrobiota bacterium]
MFSTMINVLTAPSETMESIVDNFNWRQSLYPIALLMSLAIISGIILSDQIADIQWVQMEKSISNNSNIPQEQKEEILSNQYDRIYGQSNSWAGMFTYISMAISWPIRIASWSLFAMIAANLSLGGGGTYGKIFTIASFAYLPSLVEYIIKTPIQYISDNILIYTGLGIFGIGEQGEFLNSFLNGIDLFASWRVFIMAIGLSLLYKKTTKTSMYVVTSLWLFGLIFFSGLGAFFAGFSN